MRPACKILPDFLLQYYHPITVTLFNIHYVHRPSLVLSGTLYLITKVIHHNVKNTKFNQHWPRLTSNWHFRNSWCFEFCVIMITALNCDTTAVVRRAIFFLTTTTSNINSLELTFLSNFNKMNLNYGIRVAQKAPHKPHFMTQILNHWTSYCKPRSKVQITISTLPENSKWKLYRNPEFTLKSNQHAISDPIYRWLSHRVHLFITSHGCLSSALIVSLQNRAVSADKVAHSWWYPVCSDVTRTLWSLQWRHMSVKASEITRYFCNAFMLTIKETTKPALLTPIDGNPPVRGWFPSQRTHDAEILSGSFLDPGCLIYQLLCL